MGLGFESQADHDDLYIRHNVRFYARYVFVSCVFLFALHAVSFSLAPSRPLHVSNRVNQGLRGEVLPRSAFCSMQNQNIPSPLLHSMERGCLLLLVCSSRERHFRNELPSTHKLKYAAQFGVTHSCRFLHAQAKLRR